MSTETVIPFPMQIMCCTKCGAETNASCNCGVTYVPAAKRVAKYDRENPGRSNRAVANDLGVDEKTVRKARADRSAPDEVTGRDGKKYPATRTQVVTVEDDLEADEYREAFLLRAVDALTFAIYSGEVDQEVIAAAERVVAKWQSFVQTLKNIEKRSGWPEDTHPTTQ
jgi:hypothetical protein